MRNGTPERRDAVCQPRSAQGTSGPDSVWRWKVYNTVKSLMLAEKYAVDGRRRALYITTLFLASDVRYGRDARTLATTFRRCVRCRV
ncbi:hypothetical protein KCP77_05100 [Salmonella enterica subsp. enterica]|nr:hypothetical protein KCP77_05100 [Salmonella enterica subsp. enterica]